MGAGLALYLRCRLARSFSVHCMPSYEEACVIDPTIELPIPLGHVPKLKLIPSRAGRTRRINISTVYRWSTRGLRRVVLETIQIGGTRCTSEAALVRFFHRLSARTEPPRQDWWRAVAFRGPPMGAFFQQCPVTPGIVYFEKSRCTVAYVGVTKPNSRPAA
jgi:hypothetical protein